MTGSNRHLADLQKAVAGRWEGDEIITTGPNETVSALGRFETAPVLNGRGFASEYVQSVMGTVTLRCHTTYAVDDDGQVQMAWVPSSGEAQLFRGRIDGCTIVVSRRDEQGMVHTISSNYASPGSAEISSVVSGEGTPDTVLFSANYKRSAEQ